VTDNATGIAEADQERIFEPFFSTKPSTGIGLGLNFVSKYLISGGNCSLERQTG
jgi:signal transduction histidine kinase